MADSDDSSDVPRIYVACLHCYNSGRLHGRWFDVGTDPDELHHQVLGHFASGCETCGNYEPECPECSAFAAPFPCGGEELAVHDHEGLGDVGVTGLRLAQFPAGCDQAVFDAFLWYTA